MDSLTDSVGDTTERMTVVSFALRAFYTLYTVRFAAQKRKRGIVECHRRYGDRRLIHP